MLEDDQRFEELESKLAALSSQVESLELDTEVDPFFEDDVRRVIDDFKSRELAGLESEDFGGEGFEDDESSSSDDFISVQTTGGPSFKTHWISPTSCENMTRDLARDAFVQGAADRYGTSQQVNNGDVLILLCREPVASSGSEPAEPEAPKKICRYIGLAYNTLVHPSSAEPTSATEESISAPVGNYEIFVWSSCDCSSYEQSSVNISSLSISSSSSDTNKYASIGDAASPVLDTVSGLVTDITVDNSGEKAAIDAGSLNSIGIGSVTLSNNSAGLKTGLVSLSEKLTDYYVNYAHKSVTLKGTRTNIDDRVSAAESILSKTSSLIGNECGFSSVSISAASLDVFKPGSVESSHAFLNSVSVSLGVSVFNDGSIDDTNFIPSYRVSSSAYEDLTEGSTVFLPVITEENADEIENSSTLDTQAFSLTSATVTSDSSGVTVSIGTSISTVTANYSSGLLTHKDLPVVSLGNLSFTVPIQSTDGTSVDHSPKLYKVTQTSPEATNFYQKSVSIFSSEQALIDFHKGLAVSIYQPSYGSASVLSLDASNHTDNYSNIYIDDISVRAQYDVIYSDSNKGSVSYYVDYTQKTVTTEVKNGLVTSITEESSGPFTEGPIIVSSELPLKYSCDPEYGCQPDPAGDYDEPTCGGGCVDSSTPILTFRPSTIYRVDPNFYIGGGCATVGVYNRSGAGGPSTQSYENEWGATFLLEKTPDGATKFNNSILGDSSTGYAYYSTSAC